MSTAAPTKPQAATGGYSVARAQGKCHVSGKAINPGDKFMAAVRETPLGLERLDIAPEYWDAFDKKDLLGYWHATMPEPTAKKQVFVDDAVLCELFERLAEASEPAKLNFRFVLGLILMRKRMLVYETTHVENEKEIWTVRLKGKDEKLDLLNPKLDEQQVAEVSTQLGEILNGEV